MNNSRQIPETCDIKELKKIRIISFILILIISLLLIFSLIQLKNIFYIISLIIVSFLTILFLLYILAFNNLSKHLIINENGFYQVMHLFPFSRCDSLYDEIKLIYWNKIILYMDLISIVIVIEKKDSKRKSHFLSFKKKEEIYAKSILINEFQKRKIKKVE